MVRLGERMGGERPRGWGLGGWGALSLLLLLSCVRVGCSIILFIIILEESFYLMIASQRRLTYDLRLPVDVRNFVLSYCKRSYCKR